MKTKEKTFTGYGSRGFVKEISMPKKTFKILSKYENVFIKKLKQYIKEYDHYSENDHEQMKFKLAYSENLGCEYYENTFEDFNYEWVVFNGASLRNKNEKPHLKFITSQLNVNWEFGTDTKAKSYLFKIPITKEEANYLKWEYRDIYNYFRNLKYILIKENY